MKKIFSILFTCILLISLVLLAPTTDVSAKKKKNTNTAATISEEASHFTVDTWKATYGNWSKKQIEKASTKGTGKTLLKTNLYDLKLAKDKDFVNICTSIGDFTGQGLSGYIEDKNNALCDYLQSKIKTVEDLWLYYTLSGYSYFSDGQSLLEATVDSWNMLNDARINLSDNGGICCHTSSVLNYMLEDDYEETGVVVVHAIDSPHMYNYVKSDGTYYLVDFTDFTSAHHEFREAFINLLDSDLDGYINTDALKKVDELYADLKQKICFWSGKTLNDPSATKAVLIHDTLQEGNFRKNLSWKWTNKNTQAIFAIRYYNGMYGSPVSFLLDDDHRIFDDNNDYSIKYGDQEYKLSYFGFSFPEYTWYQMMYIDSAGSVVGTPYKEIAPIELRLVPWYCDISPEAQKIVEKEETYLEKMIRQVSWGADRPFKITDPDGEINEFGLSYESAYFNKANPEIRTGALPAYEITLSYGSSAAAQGISPEKFLSGIPGFLEMYPNKIIKK